MSADRRGTILLLALLVMSGMLIVGASLGTISILNLRQSRVIDDAIIAFGAAETGAEQTLYQIRRVGASAAALDAAPDHDDGEEISGPPMGNGSRWTRNLESSETTIFASVPEDRSYEVVLWDPDAPASPAGVESLAFAWNDICGGTSALEVLATGWDPAGVGGFDPSIAFHGDSPAFTFLRATPQVVDNDFRPDLAYRVRLRAKVCDITDLSITAYESDDADGAVVPIPSRVSVESSGTFGSAKQAVELRLPRLQPLSGVFDYVVFSQCSLLKGVSGGVCP